MLSVSPISFFPRKSRMLSESKFKKYGFWLNDTSSEKTISPDSDFIWIWAQLLFVNKIVAGMIKITNVIRKDIFNRFFFILPVILAVFGIRRGCKHCLENIGAVTFSRVIEKQDARDTCNRSAFPPWFYEWFLKHSIHSLPVQSFWHYDIFLILYRFYLCKSCGCSPDGCRRTGTAFPCGKHVWNVKETRPVQKCSEGGIRGNSCFWLRGPVW